MEKHVLVVDDNRLILQIADDILSRAGYRVSTAEDVIYCNDIIYGKNPPDLILMDINLPFMSGDHKVRIMKSREKGSQIPIILISSAGEEELRSMTAASGADGCLRKPLDRDLLLATVARVLDGRP
jgi:DNA-binding response OmpR family regulator